MWVIMASVPDGANQQSGLKNNRGEKITFLLLNVHVKFTFSSQVR